MSQKKILLGEFFFSMVFGTLAKKSEKAKKILLGASVFESRLYQNGCGVITIIFIIVFSLLCATHCDMFEPLLGQFFTICKFIKSNNIKKKFG